MQRKRYLVSEPMHRITSQEFLGELCHLLSKFDTVIVQGSSINVAMETQRIDKGLTEFIVSFSHEYVAVDICAYLYRAIMQFETKAYSATKIEHVQVLCREMKKEPGRGKFFVRALKYPIFSDQL
ncbi:hypothetical protein [Mesorhizobium sp. M0678]|uniref:hypothetical protein n=1 Tax=Mesorhizobium sp. M0678 TaxID=2956985 RepID=UPI003335C524